MAIVEARFQELAFPECCCSCGNRSFTWRSHTEKVVVWTVLSITKYRRISLQIPACDQCVFRPWLWFGGAAALIGLVLLYVSNASSHDKDVGFGVLLPIFAAIGMILKGQGAKPLNILGFDNDDQMIKLRIHSESVARRMLKQRGHYESEHRRVRKPLLIVLGVVVVPFLLTLVAAIARHHGQ